MDTNHRLEAGRSRQGGFTLVEILIVIVIIGVLSTVSIFAVRGITNRGQESACGAEARTLSTAADVYFAREQVEVLPAAGVDDDRYEQLLVDDGLLKSVSKLYDLDADGTATSNGEPCP